SEHALPKTRRTLFYPLFYIMASGLGMLFAPQLSLKLMLSNGTYDDTFIMMAGGILLGLWGFLFQVVRLQVANLYTTAIWVRVVFCSVYIWLYFRTSDPFFLVVLGIVGPGLVATSVTYLKER
ncbi:MAG: hypothetical protein ABL958_21390, partial [Bdellovibrionia bacterium]